jgi:methylamine dehydrogenase heavy chain
VAHYRFPRTQQVTRWLGTWLCGAIALAGTGAVAATSAPLTPEVSDVAVLPPTNAHRVWLVELYSGQLQIVDGDSGDLLGSVYSATLSNFASGRVSNRIYVAESVWSKGNRGTRQDMVTVYDGTTLKLLTEIPLPGRVYMAPLTHNFAVSAGGTRGYVYNMQPAASVIVTDLVANRMLRSVDIPGCALAFPWGDNGFSSLCGNGSLATVSLDGAHPAIKRSEVFFDAENDPVFDESPSNRSTGRTFFITYSGVVHPAVLSATPTLEEPWSLQQAAGLQPASVEGGTLAWRPGGRLPFAVHGPSGRLYVLMHAGEPWSHKKEGTELWVADTKERRVVRRMSLPTAVSAIAVSQDPQPLLYLIDVKETLTILDGMTLDEKKKVEQVRGVVPYVPDL